MTDTAYAEDGDLLIGQIPVPGYVDKQKVLNDAADEVDSYIGFVYETPVDVSEIAGLGRPAKLLLKRITVSLASGRLILAAAAGGEDSQLHSYGASLVNDALKALNMIAAREIILDGAPTAGDSPQTSGPMIFNTDIESNVDAFYNRIANPSYCYPWVERRFRHSDGFGVL